MINLNANVVSAPSKTAADFISPSKADNTSSNETDFAKTIKAVGDYVSNVDDLQQSSDMSIKDLLSGKNEDITSVVAAMTKADLSFKLLVGVRNKLIEAYKQTLNMQI